MRWLLLKDLQILRRSPLLVGLLVLYPVVLALLVGVALDAGPSKPKVAFVNVVPKDEERGRRSAASSSTRASTPSELFKSIDPIRRQDARGGARRSRPGDALGALIVPAGHHRAAAERARPAGAASRRRSRSSTTPTTR